MMRLIFIFIAIILICSPIFAQSNQELWDQATELYDSADYIQALENYEKLLGRDIASPDLYYNIGNTYFRTNRLGYSIWAYRTALKFDPDFKQAESNLEFARSFNLDKIEHSDAGFIFDVWASLANMLSYNGFLVLFFVAWWGVAGLIIFLVLRGNIASWLHYLLIAAIIVAIFSATAAYSRIRTDRLARWGVIVVEAVDIREGPGEDFGRIEVGHEGLEFKIISSRENSYLIELGNGLKGWVEKEAALEI